MKMVAVFNKKARLRFIGHLDLMRTMQRALRRSGLPIRFSQGFNPHILLSFASPLSVGIEGKRELMEVPLAKEMSEEEFKIILSAALPADLPCIEVHAEEDTHPSVMSLCYAARYACIPEKNDDDLLKEDLARFLAQKEIPAVRHTKSGDKNCDLRPMIHEAEIRDGAIIATLDLRESSTCKPDLFLNTFYAFRGMEAPRFRLIREQLLGLKENQLVPLETL